MPDARQWRGAGHAACLAALIAALIAVPLPSPAAAAPAPVGVLLADHGEPPVYNADTYDSFREFFAHLVHMGVIPKWLTLLDRGTVYTNARCPLCPGPAHHPKMIDAWLQPHDGPTVEQPGSEDLPPHHVAPGGPGLGEPDLYEIVGLTAYAEWRAMGGRSPNYDEKLAKKRAVERWVKQTYGDRVVVRTGYGIDPRLGGGRQGIQQALERLVNRDRIGSLVVAYHGVGFSDIMQTHHLRHEVRDVLADLGAKDLPLRYTRPLGTTPEYTAAVADKVRSELHRVPENARVAIHLSGHGLPTTTCGDYDCGADAYHASSAALFRRVLPAVRAAAKGYRAEVFHTYGDGATGDDDPDNKVDGPLEAMDKRTAAGFTHVIDIPYEFDSNSRDTLIVLRRGYDRPTPDWNRALESHFRWKDLHVTIANVNGGERLKTLAYQRVIRDALAATGARPAAGSPDGHEH